MGKLRRIMGKSRRKSRRDNRKRRNEELEWVDFDEEDEDEDYYEEDNEVDEEEEYYEEDEEEEYYEEDEIDEEEEYYEEDEEDEEEEYYEEDEIDEEEEYYEEDEEDEEEEYYEEDEIDDDEEYYGEDEEDDDDDEEYYEEDEVDDDEEYYEEDEVDDDEEYYEEDDESSDGVLGRVVYKITHMSAVDHIVAFTGAAVLVLAVVTGILYLNARSSKQQIETFAEIGAGMENIGIIGEAGLLAVADAQAARMMVAEMEQQMEEEPVEEKDASGKIEVTMNLTSIQKDLKIKFINKKTGKLIPNIAFVVEIEKPSGGSYTKEDDDKDGIIYLTDIEAGQYKVKITSPASDSEYNISAEAIAVTVKDTIEYKKVDIVDEVKTESQVNAAAEDTKVNETVVESTNTDTVEWVESTKTLIDGTQKDEHSYEKVDKSQIADPGKSASSGFRLLAATQGELGEGEPTQAPEQTQEPDPTEAPTEPPAATPTVMPTSEATATPEATPTAAVTATPVVTPTTTPAITPTITPSVTPTITPSISPSVSPSVTPSVTPSVSPSVTPTATPNGAKTDTKSTLKTTSGETLYIIRDGSYVEAKYADYYTAKEFYRKVTKTTGEYRYTGWQTIDNVTYFFDKNGNKVTGEQVIQGAKYSFNSDGSLNNSSGHLGIDVSKWNGNINWEAVKNSGISYVIIRCGYRGSSTGALIEDPLFRSNIQGATKAGLKVGIYFFTQAVNEVEAVEEASMVLSLISGYNITYPVFLDVEASNGRADGISASTRTAVCKAFCQTIQNSGYKAGIYANKTWLNSYIDAPSLTGYRIWLAQYAAAPSYTRTRYDMWQYSSKGKVSGISTDVDMNISYMGY